MKPGARALGIAESFTAETSTLAGVLMTADGRIEDFVFGRCTVGGTDVTDEMITLVDRLEREDTSVILVAGIALAWYNIVNLERLADTVSPPVIAVSFEESDGLEDAIKDAFEDEQRRDRLERYQSLPPRDAITVAGRTLFIRSPDLSMERASDIVEAYMAEGTDRPEPLRVANLAARAADEVNA